MKFSTEKPPVFERCKEQFGIGWETVIITYGDTVHSKYPVPDHLIAHEAIHIGQQLSMGVEKWWEQYFEDERFRLSQEVPAYKAQLEFLKAHYSRPERRRIEKHIYWSMGALYGDMCTEEEAKELIK